MELEEGELGVDDGAMTAMAVPPRDHQHQKTPLQKNKNKRKQPARGTHTDLRAASVDPSSSSSLSSSSSSSSSLSTSLGDESTSNHDDSSTTTVTSRSNNTYAVLLDDHDLPTPDPRNQTEIGASDDEGDEDDQPADGNSSSSGSHASFTIIGNNPTAQDEPTVMDRRTKRKLRKKRRKVAAGKGTRQDFVDVYGAKTAPTLELKLAEFFKPGQTKQKLQTWDIQQLILWLLADALCPKWVFVKDNLFVEKIVVVFIDSLSAALLQEYGAHLPSLTAAGGLFPHPPCPSHIPMSLFSSTSVLQGYMSVNTKHMIMGNKSQKKKSEHEKVKLPALHYILTTGEMEENKYPVKDQAGFLRTRSQQWTLRSNQKSGRETVGENGGNGGRLDLREGGSETVPLETNHSTKTASQPATATTEVAINHTDEKHKSINGDDSSTSPSCASESSSTSSSSSSFSSSASPCPRLDLDTPVPLFAIDCEMCYTASGLELTRVTILDEHGQTVYDQFVKPTNVITDYNTKYSGITEADLKDVTTTLADVQQYILKLITSECILVGHSVENDLNALQIYHERIIDTAILYPHPKGPPSKSALRYLTSKFLNRKIQTETHNSVEDAQAALELTKLKLANGPSFGVSAGDTESLFSILAKSRRACSMIASSYILRVFAPSSVSAVPVSSDSAAVAKLASEVTNRNDLVWVHLTELGGYYDRMWEEKGAVAASSTPSGNGASTILSSSTSPTPPAAAPRLSALPESASAVTASSSFAIAPPPITTTLAPVASLNSLLSSSSSLPPHPLCCSSSSSSSSSSLSSSSSFDPLLLRALTDLDARMRGIYEACPNNTLLMVLSGQSVTKGLKRLQELKIQLTRDSSSGAWMSEQEAELQRLQHQVSNGVSLVTIVCNNKDQQSQQTNQK